MTYNTRNIFVFSRLRMILFMICLFLYYVPHNIDSIVNQVMDIKYKQKDCNNVSEKHCHPYLKPLDINVVHVQTLEMSEVGRIQVGLSKISTSI